MAWISGLADKAENILNKLDQNAATALNQVPPSASDAFSEMRKSLSSGALALKPLSPAKSQRNMFGPTSTGVKSTNDLPQLLPAISAHSRRSSADSKDAITITVTPEEETTQNHVATSMSSSFTEPQELAAFKIALAEVTSERDALRGHLASLNNDSDILQLKTRIEELEVFVHCLNEEREALQQEILKLQTSNSAYVHSISELETNLAKLQQEYLETAQKLQMQMSETEQQRQDLQEYRIKAQHTLQMKDNLITELKTKGATVNGLGKSPDESESHVLQLENETMREELQSIKEERQMIVNQLEQLREQLQEINKEHTRQVTEMRENEAALRKELRTERERMLTNESEQRVLTQEIYTLRQQYNQHLADAKARLQEKEQQLQQLRTANQTNDYTVKSNIFADAEVRLKALTQALVEKQQTVELITSEKNALRIQLEKLQEQHSNYMQNFQNSSSTRNALLSNSTDDAKAQYPLLTTFAPNPFDNRVARRVKRAYTSLDSAGVRLGTFLRRYPLMRVFVLVYVALLHIWVMFVLLSSTPI